jgi:octaprenyl-diphosphate synthase
MRDLPEQAPGRLVALMQLEQIRTLVKADLKASSDDRGQAVQRRRPRQPGAEYIISRRRQAPAAADRGAGGPRLRLSDGTRHTSAAAFIEFIHTATLLHDDVVDHSSLRRGRHTANAVFGNQASVLVGDFVYSRAFQMMAASASRASWRSWPTPPT